MSKRSKVLDIEYNVTQYSPEGKPIEITFEDGVVYNRKEMDLLMKISEESIREMHMVKVIMNGAIIALENVLLKPKEEG